MNRSLNNLSGTDDAAFEFDEAVANRPHLIDETVILRYLLDDDPQLSKTAREVIGEGTSYTFPSMFARVAVILRDVYGVPRSQIAVALIALLDDITVRDEDIVRYACRLFGSSMFDFLDCLIIGHNILRGEPVISFEKPLMRRALSL